MVKSVDSGIGGVDERERERERATDWWLGEMRLAGAKWVALILGWVVLERKVNSARE